MAAGNQPNPVHPGGKCSGVSSSGSLSLHWKRGTIAVVVKVRCLKVCRLVPGAASTIRRVAQSPVCRRTVRAASAALNLIGTIAPGATAGASSLKPTDTSRTSVTSRVVRTAAVANRSCLSCATARGAAIKSNGPGSYPAASINVVPANGELPGIFGITVHGAGSRCGVNDGSANSVSAKMIFLDSSDAPEKLEASVGGGSLVAFSCPAPDKETPNEDSVAAIPYGPDAAVLIIADGAGGLPAGRRASRMEIGRAHV